MGNSLVNSKGVKSLRNVDYTTYYALAELIDNSLQWGAKTVHILVIQEEDVSGERLRRRIREVIIYDDGQGMSRETLDCCLQYGGGNNGPKSKKMGKFGMGLPNASGSQSSRTEVFSWQKAGDSYFNVLDFDDLERQEHPEIPDASPRQVPSYIRRLIPAQDWSGDGGTVVIWKNCDQIQHKTVKAFARNLEMFLGRVYRYWLQGEHRIIFSAHERIGKEIRTIPDFEPRLMRVMDPLFLMTPNCIESYESQALNESWASEIQAVPVGDKDYRVRIKFSIAKAETQDREGSTRRGVGHKVYRKLMGVSLLRARRELKHHDFGFVTDRGEYRHRWWSCEVEFGPELDELFKVTNDKQEARGFRQIPKEEYEDKESYDESLDLMYEISKIITSNIGSMMSTIKGRKKGSKQKEECPQCRKHTIFLDNRCKECGFKLQYCAKHPNKPLVDGTCAVCLTTEPEIPDTMCTLHNTELIEEKCPFCEQARRPLTAAERRELEEYLKNFYPKFLASPELLSVATDHYTQSGRSHFIAYVDTPGSAFIMPDKFGDITIIAINRRHSFYERFIRPKIEDRDEGNEIVPIHMLVGAFVRAEYDDYENREIYDMFRDRFSLNLKKLMNNYDLD